MPEKRDYTAGSGLRDLGALFEDAWEIYKQRFATLVLLSLISVALLLGPFLILTILGLLPGLISPDALVVSATIGSSLGFTAGFVLMFIPMAAIILAIDDSSLDVKTSMKEAYTKFWPFLWVMGLMGFIIPGGFMLFFLPGIIFSVWFLLAQFIVLLEPERGMMSLLKSKAYARGHWWGVLGRLLLLAVFSGVVSMFPFGTIFFNPYMMVVLYLIYIDLREEKGPEPAYASSAWDRLKWPLIAIIGCLFPLALMALAYLQNADRISELMVFL